MAFTFHDSDWSTLPEFIWKRTFRCIPWKKRPQLEIVCKQWRDIMPYDDLTTEFVNDVEGLKLFRNIDAKRAHKRVKFSLIKLSDASNKLLDIVRCNYADSRLALDFRRLKECVFTKLMSGQMKNVTSLYVSRLENGVTQLHDSACLATALPKLRYFTWNWCEWSPHSLPATLEELSVTKHWFSINLDVLLAPCINLRTLELRYCTFDGKVQLPFLPRLNCLQLGEMSDIAPIMNKLGAACPALERLELDDCGFCTSSIAPLKTLVYLELYHIKGSISDLLNACNTNLQHIKLTQCKDLKILQSQKCPTDELSLTNCLIVNPQDYDSNSVKYVEIKHVTGAPHRFVFGLKNHASMRRGELGFNLMQRKWAQVSLGVKLEVSSYPFTENDYISSITLQADFLMDENTTTDPYDTDKMAQEFLMQFPRQPFTIGQLIVFQFLDKKQLELTVIDMEAADISAAASAQQSYLRKFAHGKAGVLIPNTNVIFDKAPYSMLNLSGKSKGNPDWDFETMGIGGLDHQFNAIFRRAFASRVFPPEFIEQLGIKHVRGILLYGPPGTGKTLMVRQIGKMLNAREPNVKMVNSPQIFDKHLGQSEANIRKLFADAEEENKRVGANSGLHIIIFDDIDAICKQRGLVAGSSAVHDSVVNQLLSSIDGVAQLNNILVIGTTNRRDMIDEALLRPGRLEVQIEINLPDKKGRVEILNIHTSRMREYKKIAGDVDLEELGDLTKNFSGAELEGLVRAAQSYAINRLVKVRSKVLDPDAIEKLMVNRNDFLYALANDVKPAFGLAADT